jgi:bacterioferritin (cytochrome b1)
MENLNTNIQHQPSYDTIKQQRDHFEERLKIEREKREALESKIASFLDPIIESKLDDFKTDLEDKVYELESKVDDIDTEADIAEMVATELNQLIRDNRLTVRLELD